MNNKFSFLFYDYETFGLNTALDKPSQFAAIRTDLNFNIIKEKHCFYCYPSIDYFPDPEAILLTKITPQYTIKNGLNEFYFSRKIFKILNTSNTCILGYNNLNFDDEITRNIFYRNFLDIYSWSWANCNSRWDVIYLLQACYVLTPNKIIWPKNKFGNISFKLEDLTRVNNIQHNSHDALSDVHATINLIRLIKTKKPELFNFFFKYRLKNNIKKLINITNYVPIFYISQVFGINRNYITCIIPIFWNINNSNQLIFFDLYMDIKILINYLHVTKISEMSLKKLYDLGINILNINKCPLLIPINIFNQSNLIRFGINLNIFFKKINFLKKSNNFIKKIISFFKNYNYMNVVENVDLKIYDGFFDLHDKNIMRKIHNIKPNKWKKIIFNFHQDKLNEMFFRLRARNFPELLNIYEKIKWKNYCLTVFSKQKIYDYFLKLNFLLTKYNSMSKEYQLLLDLKKYINSLII